MLDTTEPLLLNVLLRRYRFRLVNTACDSAFFFSIDGHDLNVIEADGKNVESLIVNIVPIYPGGHSFARSLSLSEYLLFNRRSAVLSRGMFMQSY